jgi:glycosyltransferase involved in cell wall biosynthesis
MANLKAPLLSVVVPLYNEAGGLQRFHDGLLEVVKGLTYDFEIIYVDDGSEDDTTKIIRQFSLKNESVKLLKLSRNFGKENALTAGITAARGPAILMLDGDGQHPVESIPEFFEKWQNGAKVVVGIRQGKVAGWMKRTSSRLFYKLFNRLTGQQLKAGSTDFRLLDRSVQQVFLELKERDRITRGLIDWLGFKRDYVYFKASPRMHGEAAYSSQQLINLATNSFVSLSPKPLYMIGYLGVFITAGALVLGSVVFFEQIILNDPFNWNFTGTAMLGILTLFLVGIVLLSQGILSLYVSHIHSQSKGRPLYVIDAQQSIGIQDEG